MQGNNHDFEEREQQRKARFRVGSNGVSTPFILEYLERVPTTLDF